jgi:thioredoxin 1
MKMKPMNMTMLLASVAIGCLLGAALGYYGQCSSGTCPLTSTCWRGSLYGGVMGLVFYMLSGNGGSAVMKQSTKNVTLIGENEFDKEVVQSVEPVLVDFFATWCGPCKALAPVVDDLAGQFKGRIKFVNINADEARTLTQRYHVDGLPTLMMFQNGKVTDAIVGLLPSEELKVRLNAAVQRKESAMAPTAGVQLPLVGN